MKFHDTLYVMQPSFTQKQATEIVGISPNTLQGWTRDGLIIPSIANPKGRGKTRLYSASDLTLMKIISYLSDSSFNRDVIKSLCDYLYGKLPFGVNIKDVARKFPHSPGVNYLSNMKENLLNPLLKRSKPVLLKLSDDKWDEIGSGGLVTTIIGDSTRVLIINVTKIMEEIKQKLK